MIGKHLLTVILLTKPKYVPDSVGVLNTCVFKVEIFFFFFSGCPLKNEVSRASRGCVLYLLEGLYVVSLGLAKITVEWGQLYFLVNLISTNLQ